MKGVLTIALPEGFCISSHDVTQVLFSIEFRSLFALMSQTILQVVLYADVEFPLGQPAFGQLALVL